MGLRSRLLRGRSGGEGRRSGECSLWGDSPIRKRFPLQEREERERERDAEDTECAVKSVRGVLPALTLHGVIPPFVRQWSIVGVPTARRAPLTSSVKSSRLAARHAHVHTYRDNSALTCVGCWIGTAIVRRWNVVGTRGDWERGAHMVKCMFCTCSCQQLYFGGIKRNWKPLQLSPSLGRNNVVHHWSTSLCCIQRLCIKMADMTAPPKVKPKCLNRSIGRKPRPSYLGYLGFISVAAS